VKRALFVLILLSASGMLFAQVSVVPPAFGTVRAGETARIEWQGLPRGVEELELLLTIEGRALPIRVTPQLIARTGVILWRVPNLPSRRARLAVRYGLDGEEIEGEPGAAFEILPAAGEPPATLDFRQGEWWACECAEDRFPGALEPREDGDRVQEERQGAPCADSPQSVPGPPGISSRAARSEIFREAPASVRPALPHSPIEVPARI
jgi:hypothetical protein